MLNVMLTTAGYVAENGIHIHWEELKIATFTPQTILTLRVSQRGCLML